MPASHQGDIARKSVNIPGSNAVFDRAKLDVVDQEHDVADLLRRYGYTAVVDAAYHQSRKASHPFFSPDSGFSCPDIANWRALGVQILSDTPLVMLQAVLDDSRTDKVMSGDAAHAALSDYFDQEKFEEFAARPPSTAGLRTNRWVLRHKSQFAPAFHVRVLADAQGESPTPVQLRRVILRMRQYVSGNADYIDECVAIDNISRSTRSDRISIAERQHYFLDGSTQRVQAILTFCEALDLLLQTHAPPRSPQESLPFKYKLKYFGFTVNDTVRSRNHEAGNTNWLKSFFHSICRVEFKDADDQPVFYWHHHVIGFATSVEECHLGEELFCQIGSGYYQTGLGFNIQPAGLSVNSAYLEDCTPKEAAQVWKHVLRWREEGPDFGDQLYHELNICIPVYKQAVIAKRDAQRQAKQRKQDLVETRDRLRSEIDSIRDRTPTEADVRDEIRTVQDTARRIEQECSQKLPEGIQDMLRRSHAFTIADLEARAKRLFENQ
jgi:hypothetical protein